MRGRNLAKAALAARGMVDARRRTRVRRGRAIYASGRLVMDPALILVQALNGVQLGVMLFVIAAGGTLVFGAMDLFDLAHGSRYVGGAYLTTTSTARPG